MRIDGYAAIGKTKRKEVVPPVFGHLPETMRVKERMNR